MKKMNKKIDNLLYSFPIQLLILHIRSNHFLILIWLILILFLTGTLGSHFGIQYLFLDPEYLGQVNFWSFLFMGMAFGGFFITWNLTTYLLSAHFFPFLATLNRPFTKYSLNNFIVPLLFLLIFVGYIIRFQVFYEFFSLANILFKLLGFFIGGIFVVTLTAIYLTYTNRDIEHYVKKRKNAPPNLEKFLAPGRRDVDLNELKSEKAKWKVKTYLTEQFNVRLVRSVQHYDSKLLLRIFRQNHGNALFIQLFSLFVIILLGILIENPVFRIPAAASVFIFASILISIGGAITYWFAEWKVTVFVLLLIGINWATGVRNFNYNNHAYGMDYNVAPATYSLEALQDLIKEENVEEDKEDMLKILENWKAKQESPKPKMVITCVSGGGLKASAWAVNVLEHADKKVGGDLFDKTVLISGSSGGLIGTAYLREKYLRKETGEISDIYGENNVDKISEDLLNSIAFMIVSNDLFLPWLKFEKNGYHYKKDRGFIFEKQLNENTDGVMDKTMLDYKTDEMDATIPLMFVTPAIVNDGRRMIISSQNVSYMMVAPIGVDDPDAVEIDAVDFNRLFSEQNSGNMSFTTALRMNATYPFILPNVHLPSEPIVEVLDAGFRDNFGVKSAVRYMQVFGDWIKENTDGVVLVLIQGRDRSNEISESESKGIISNLFDPLGIVSKMLRLQEYDHDTNLGFMYELLGEDKFDIVRFKYRPLDESEEASMTFHLTEREKRGIVEAIESEENLRALDTLEALLKTEEVQKPILSNKN